jgi:ATP-dependent DNA ligase
MLYTFSLPSQTAKVPVGPDWLHEVKYDGYRRMVIREQDRVRLIRRGGHDWARRFPNPRRAEARRSRCGTGPIAGFWKLLAEAHIGGHLLELGE